jgi:hypothetical protein
MFDRKKFCTICVYLPLRHQEKPFTCCNLALANIQWSEIMYEILKILKITKFYVARGILVGRYTTNYT